MKAVIARRLIQLFLLVVLIAGCQENPPMSNTASSPAPAAPTPEVKKSVPGAIVGTRLTEAYVALMGRYVYFWAWPMANIYNRVQILSQLPGPVLMGGIVPVAPPNQLTMLTDYVAPEERMVACPNQDVVYGFGPLSLDREPAVVQVPDFGDRFWVYQIVDQRTDSFAQLGKMYGSKPGFYLLVGPDWNGQVPTGIQGVFHSPTNLGIVVPRVFKQSTPEDTAAVQRLINQISMYPLSKWDGKMKTTDWSKTPPFKNPAGDSQEETKWVDPTKFVDQLPKILDGMPPMPGEEHLYATIRQVWDAANKDPKLKAALQQAVIAADKELVTPVFQFRNYGLPLAGNWTTQNNGAQFGTDYFTRTAVAKSNIFVNSPNETKYFYQDLDSTGGRLNGAHSYTVTFAKDALPPVKGFWSLTMYDAEGFQVPNPINRFAIGDRDALKLNVDGSLDLYIQNESPGRDKESNWLPAPKSGELGLTLRLYAPQPQVLDGRWNPPAIKQAAMAELRRAG